MDVILQQNALELSISPQSWPVMCWLERRITSEPKWWRTEIKRNRNARGTLSECHQLETSSFYFNISQLSQRSHFPSRSSNPRRRCPIAIAGHYKYRATTRAHWSKVFVFYHLADPCSVCIMFFIAFRRPLLTPMHGLLSSSSSCLTERLRALSSDD